MLFCGFFSQQPSAACRLADIILQSERGGSYLKVDHGRERGEDAGHKLGGVEQELSVHDEDGADLKVELLEPFDELAHHRDVRVQLDLTYSVGQKKTPFHRMQLCELQGWANKNAPFHRMQYNHKKSVSFPKDDAT